MKSQQNYKSCRSLQCFAQKIQMAARRSCRSQRMLKNAYFVANLGAEAAENEQRTIAARSSETHFGSLDFFRQSVWVYTGIGIRNSARGCLNSVMYIVGNTIGYNWEEDKELKRCWCGPRPRREAPRRRSAAKARRLPPASARGSAPYLLLLAPDVRKCQTGNEKCTQRVKELSRAKVSNYYLFCFHSYTAHRG